MVQLSFSYGRGMGSGHQSQAAQLRGFIFVRDRVRDSAEGWGTCSIVRSRETLLELSRRSRFMVGCPFISARARVEDLTDGYEASLVVQASFVVIVSARGALSRWLWRSESWWVSSFTGVRVRVRDSA